MALKCPTVDEGEIYCIREVDFISKNPTVYVKLGKTKRDTNQRLKEHQTGNPRQETAEFVFHTDMMSSLEKYLHYHFANDCVNSEWFVIDTPRVLSEVVPLIQSLAAEHALVRPTFDEWKAQTKTVNNGKTLVATSAHRSLHTTYIDQYEEYKKAEALMNIAGLELKKMIGTSDGIHNMVYLVSTEQIPFDSKAFLASLATQADRDKCHKIETNIRPEAPKINGERPLSKIDHAMHTQLKTLEKAYESTKPNLSNIAQPPLPITPALIALHEDYLSSKKQVKEAEWALQKTTAELVSMLKNNKEIEDIIHWPREQVTKPKFEKERARKLFPTEFHAHEGTPVTKVHRVNIDDGKKYP
ncbi:MAG: hypothetical protein CMA63_04155 [Euryarchaeota archaeon]|nr:hypothetical protein [Euryarchaeota archaeon]